MSTPSRIHISFVLILAFLCLETRAQEEPHNIIIKNAVEEYSFVRNNTENPVQVNEVKEYLYYCSNSRAELPVAEPYDNYEKITNVELERNGKKVKNFSPDYSYYNIDGIFYSDQRICSFNLQFDKKEATNKVRIEKTTLDPRYLTTIYLGNTVFTERKDIRILIPSWMKVEVKDLNFDGHNIIRSETTDNGIRIISYSVSNLEGMKQESSAPGPSYLEPHILIMCKMAEGTREKITYFNTLSDQYGWYKKLVTEARIDAPAVRKKAEEIISNKTSAAEKAKAIYNWVRDNIRYVAFEDGIAGFRPDPAPSVMDKRYGDCKGMGNLLTEMLKAVGLDARLCWLGTSHLAYTYSTPSLCVDNHVISALFLDGKTYFLDATEKYLGFGELAERIQGREVLVEDGEQYLLKRIPVLGPEQNRELVKKEVSIRGGGLQGSMSRSWTGESKALLLRELEGLKTENLDAAIRYFLGNGKKNVSISNVDIQQGSDSKPGLFIHYDITDQASITDMGKEKYIELDDTKDWVNLSIDGSRKIPYLFFNKEILSCEVDLDIGRGSLVGELPKALLIERPEYYISATFARECSHIKYRREIRVRSTWLNPEHFIDFNKDLKSLKEFYNQQLLIRYD